MPDLFTVIFRWWKQITLLVILSVITAGIIVFMQPRKYLSVATALPASSLNTDKSKIFNENIQALYSELGSPDELERIIGTAELDTIYRAIAKEKNLAKLYNVNGENAIEKAAFSLRKNSRVARSEYGELKVRVWDTDKQFAADLANDIMERLQAMHQQFQNQNNQLVLTGLKQNLQRIIQSADSLDKQQPGSGIGETRRRVLIDQVAQHEKLIQQYELVVSANPRVLLTVEKARPALKPDKPRRLVTMIAVAFFSVVFAILLALVLERKKNAAS